MQEVLKYNETAADWIEALPQGNGRIGAMVYGRPQDEIISLNEDTLWSGTYRDKINHAAPYHLEEIRYKIFSGDYAGANRSIIDHVLGEHCYPYMPFGDLFLHVKTKEVRNYSRKLDLREAVSTVEFESEGAKYVREVLVSEPDQVMAVRQTCDRKASISMYIRLFSPLLNELRREGVDLVMEGRCPAVAAHESDPTWNPFFYTEDGIRFEARVRVIVKGGKYKVWQDGIDIRDADEVMLLFGIRTSFEKYNLPLKQTYSCLEDMDRAAAKSFDEIKQAHIADVTALYDRVKLDMGLSTCPDINTDEMIRAFTKDGKYSDALTSLKFHFGKYILIACSRAGTQPANLQGIWNRLLRAKWSCNYTININTQMNYLSAPLLNLPECQEPLDVMLEEMAEEGANTAKQMYRLDGWVAHHNCDLWRITSAVGHIGERCEKAAAVCGTTGHGPVRYGMWTMGGAWLCRHIWERYLHTKDERYLKRMYPVMKGAAEFMLGFLVEYEGKLVTCPSTSPENEFRAHGTTCAGTYGATCDIAILRDLFENCLEAQKVLGQDETHDRMLDALARMPGFAVGKFGQIMEWQEDFEETEVPHRHLSHLYGVFPANVVPEELDEAVRVTMERRGDESAAWEATWRAAIWARLGDGDRAFKVLTNQMVETGRSDTFLWPDGKGGMYVNLLDAYPPFQVDGVLGYPAAVGEMLVQSHRGKIELLPALPKVLATGKLEGMIIRNGIALSMEWKDGTVVWVELTSVGDQTVCLCVNGTEQIVALKAGTTVKVAV